MRRTSLARCCFKGREEEEKTKGARAPSFPYPPSERLSAPRPTHGGEDEETTCGPWSGKKGFNRPQGVPGESSSSLGGVSREFSFFGQCFLARSLLLRLLRSRVDNDIRWPFEEVLSPIGKEEARL